MMSVQSYYKTIGYGSCVRGLIYIETLNLILGGVLRTSCFSDNEVNLCRALCFLRSVGAPVLSRD